MAQQSTENVNPFDIRIDAAQSEGSEPDARLILAKIYWDRDLRPWEKRAVLEIAKLGHRGRASESFNAFDSGAEIQIPDADFVLAGTFEAFGHRPEGALGRELFRLAAYPRHYAKAEPFFWKRGQALPAVAQALLRALGRARDLPGSFSLSAQAAWSRAVDDAVADGIAERVASSEFANLSRLTALSRQNPDWSSSQSMPKELACGVPDFESLAGVRRPGCSTAALVGAGAISRAEAEAFVDAIERLSPERRISSSRFGSQARKELLSLYEEKQIFDAADPDNADPEPEDPELALLADYGEEAVGAPGSTLPSGPPRL